MSQQDRCGIIICNPTCSLMCTGLVYNMSVVLRKHSKQLVKALALSNPSRSMLTTGLFARGVIDQFEKLEISSESSPIKSAGILVGYIVSKAENKHKAAVWKELETIEALNDLVEEMKKGGTNANKLLP